MSLYEEYQLIAELIVQTDLKGIVMETAKVASFLTGLSNIVIGGLAAFMGYQLGRRVEFLRWRYEIKRVVRCKRIKKGDSLND